jgi:hypothetical protein
MANKPILDPDNDPKTPQLPCDGCKKLTNYFVRNSPNYIMVRCYKCDDEATWAYDEGRDMELSFEKDYEQGNNDW